MPPYGKALPGFNADPTKNIHAIGPGESYTLFDGTETAATGLASVAMARDAGSTAGDSGYTFYFRNVPAGWTVDIQGANVNTDTAFATISFGLTPDANGNCYYTDIGRPAFYRAILTLVTTGAMPTCIAQG